jgi:hypothetical protein
VIKPVKATALNTNKGGREMKNALNVVALLLLTFLLASCGGSGGTAGQSSSAISGVASKGPISGGIVKVYALKADGTKGDQLGSSATTKSDGTYSVNLGSYSGNVLIEVTGGTYTDEATGANDTPNPGLTAALTSVSGNVSVAVTPLTDLAVKYAGTLTKDNVEKGNSLVSSMVGVNIINTLPVDVSAAGAADADQNRVEYGLMLATISKMAQGSSVGSVIESIKNDLADDNQLNTTGTEILSALDQFINDPDHNKSGVSSSSQTSLNSAISNIKEYAVTPQPGNTDLTKAKAMVSDFRNTVLSIYNYQGVGAEGIIETPFKNSAAEFETKLKPELTYTVNRIGWIVNSVKIFKTNQAQQTFYLNDLTLTLTPGSDQKSAGIVVKDSQDNTIDSGTVTVNDLNTPTSGTFNASMKTASGGTLTVALTFAGTINSDGAYTNMTFTGSMSEPGVVEIDFSQEGRKLYATFAHDPNSADPQRIYPTSVQITGLIKTTTVQITGTINITSALSSDNKLLPKTAAIDGSFSEIVNGTVTGTKFTGTITGTWTNAGTYVFNAPTSSTNFPQWNASFNGKIEATSRPTITASLKVSQTEYQKFKLDVGYQRTNTDGSVIFISGNGVYDSSTKVLTASLTNQDGLTIAMTFDDKLSKDQRFSGAITSSGGVKQADLLVRLGMPAVKYIDNYFETLI